MRLRTHAGAGAARPPEATYRWLTWEFVQIGTCRSPIQLDKRCSPRMRRSAWCDTDFERTVTCASRLRLLPLAAARASALIQPSVDSMCI